VTLKPELAVTQGHCRWHHSICRTWLHIHVLQ